VVGQLVELTLNKAGIVTGSPCAHMNILLTRHAESERCGYLGALTVDCFSLEAIDLAR
jgi:hypothetical protein